jgi:hypothetical protein
MFISLERSRTDGFRRWSDSHKPDSKDNDDPDHDNTGVMTALARISPVLNGQVTDRAVTSGTEDQHRPWLVPGVGTSF